MTTPAPDITTRLDRLDRLATRMDSAFRIPGTRIRFGWDAILGLIPGAGDTLTLAPGAYILHQSCAMGAPKRVIARMGLNMGVDWCVGLVPFVGDLFDIGVKSNISNVALLRAQLQKAARDGLPHGAKMAHNLAHARAR